MNFSNISDEQLAVIVAGVVATIRKRFPKINGVEYVICVTFIISFITCVVLVMNNGTTSLNTSVLVKSVVRSVWITIQSVAGVSIVSYLANKVNLGGLINNSDSSANTNNSNEVNGDKKNDTASIKVDNESK